MCRVTAIFVLAFILGLVVRVPSALAAEGCGESGLFTIDNRDGAIQVEQRAQGIFLAGVEFHNTFKAVVSDWGGGSPGSVTFSLNGQSETVPYGSGSAETSAFDMGDLPSGECAVTSTMTVTAKNSVGTQVGQTTVPLRCINRPWFIPAPPDIRVKPHSPFQWGQEIVYESYPQVSFANLDATWYGANALFKNYGGMFSGGKLNIEFNGAKGEYMFEIETDVSTEPKPLLGALWKPPTNKRKVTPKGERTLSLNMSASASISQATGCFAGGPTICGGGQFGYEWKIVPIGPLFGIPGLWFTGKAGFDIGPELCFTPAQFSLDNPVPLTAVDINGNLMGQGGLELGIPYFLSIFGGLEGNAAGKIHVLGDPIPTCWDWPLLADLDFDLSIVGYARLGISEWELGRFVIVQWTCPTSGGMSLLAIPVSESAPVIRKARRPYLANGEPYAEFAPGTAAKGANIKRAAAGGGGEADELITSNVNLEATPATAGHGNLTLVVTSEDDPATTEYVEHEIQAVFRDGGLWGSKVQVTNNTDPDILPAAGFDAAGKAITAWTTIVGVTGSETLSEQKAKMEIAWSSYDNGTQTWSAPVQLTSNAVLDAMPQIVHGADGSTSLVWLRSEDNSLAVGPGEPIGTPAKIVVSRWNGSTFSEPQALLDSCDAVGPVRYARDASAREYLIWTRDTDSDLSTLADWEFIEAHTVGGVWTTPQALTSNSVPDTAAGLLATSSGIVAYYARAGTGGTAEEPEDQLLCRVFNGSSWSEESVQITAPTILAPSFAIGSSAEVGCTWVGPAVNDTGKAVLYASSPTGVGNWSEPQEMATGPNPSVPSCTYVGPNLQVSYVSARPAAGMAKLGVSLQDAGATAFDVRLLEHPPYTDLWVGQADLSVSPQPPVAGQPATISVTVHLSGDYDQTGVVVRAYDGDPGAGGTLIGGSTTDLVPGGKATIEIPWTYPSDAAEHTIYAVVDPDNTIVELLETNNSTSVPIGAINLEAVAVRPVFWTAEQVGIEVECTNSSYADVENVTLEIRRDSDTGPVILSDTVPVIHAGETIRLVLPWDISLTPPGSYPLFLLVDPSGTIPEDEETDNMISGVAGVLPDLQTEQWSVRARLGLARVIVKNVGAKPSQATVLRALLAGQNVGETEVQALNPGTEQEVTVALSAGGPGDSVTLKANPDSAGADEVTLLNNKAIATLGCSADFDLDGDVDGDDFAVFEGCASEAATPHDGSPNCQNADFDHDNDADQDDFGVFQRCYSGEGNFADPNCAG